MPKMKTHRSAAKRYKVTATGKVIRRRSGISHLLEHKSPKRKNSLSKEVEVFEGNLDMIKAQLPYKKYSR